MTIDEWSSEGKRITDESALSRVRQVLEEESPLIIEHRFYRGASAPHRFVCDDAEKFESYLREKTKAGDSFWLWRYQDLCKDDNVFERGKIPDAAGRVPLGGAY